MSFILAADATFSNIDTIPAGLVRVGYTTGTPDIKWPADVFRPSDIRICQDHGSDLTADELDVEPGAATNIDAAIWWPYAKESFDTGKRPGQRFPALYTFMNNLTPMVNELIASGITAGPVLYLAQPGDTLITAEDLLIAAGGPFPVIGIQYKFQNTIDLDVYSPTWYSFISPDNTSPQEHWAWCHKCQGLFWAPGITSSHCPAGGLHSMSGSGNYELTIVK